MQSAFRPEGTACTPLRPSSSIRTTSPGRTSRTTSAPIRSSAHVSDATTQSSPSRPRVSGRKPSGSRNATRTPSESAVTEYAPSSRAIALATASSRGAGIACDERGDDLGVGAGCQSDAVGGQLRTQLLHVDEVAVVAERDGALPSVVDERLGVRPPVRAGRGVARVADRDLAGERLELLLVEDLGDEAHVAEDGETSFVGDRDARGLLAAVLQGEQPEVRETGHVPLLRPDAEDSTHVSVPSGMRSRASTPRPRGAPRAPLRAG